MAGALVTSGADGLYSSPLGRARATAAAISVATGLDLSIIDDLTEVDHGQFAGLTNEEIEHRQPGAMAGRDAHKYEWRFPDGESYRDAELRAARALRAMADAGSRRPIVVCHEMIGRMMRRRLLGLCAPDALGFRLAHGTIASITPAPT